VIAVHRLLRRLRQPASRAAELTALDTRVRDELATEVEADERELAQAVRAQKLNVATELAAVTSCSSCASGQPEPTGHWDGGACCSGVTSELFDDNELSALVLAGTRSRDLVPPRDEHAGCAFRGARGCSLEVAHRPARCVHYVCDTLRRELHSRGRLDAVEAKLAELDTRMQAFTAVHRARRDREVLAPLIDGLIEATAAMKLRR
jgi:hypothetical protein